MADHQETLEIEVKALDGLEIKDAEKGEIEAVIATLDVVDRDRDIIRPMAIKDGARVKLSDYGHSAAFGAAPVGKGTLRIEGNKVLFRGKYFMSTSRGSEAFKMMKEIGPDESEWSFGFHVEEDAAPDEADRKKGAFRILTKLDSFEVSPVLRGAGIGTRTVSVKAAGVSAPPVPPDVVVDTPTTAELEAGIAAENTIAVQVAAELKRILEPLIQAGLVKAEGEMTPEERVILDGDPSAAEPLGVITADGVVEHSGYLEGPPDADSMVVVEVAGEAKRLADGAEAKRQAEEAEVTRLVAAEIKRLRDAAADEFERFQRTRRYLAT